MTTFLFILTSCTFGAFLVACTDVPVHRNFAHALRGGLLLTGFVIFGLPLLALMFAPHPLAKPLAFVAFLSWTSLGALWSMRLDPEASLRPLPAWILKPWSLPDALLLGALGASTILLFLIR